MNCGHLKTKLDYKYVHICLLSYKNSKIITLLYFTDIISNKLFSESWHKSQWGGVIIPNFPIHSTASDNHHDNIILNIIQNEIYNFFF